MRRRDVPCSPCGSGSSSGCGCCSLKEKLAVLWDRTIGSILKINNVTPDGDGKFEIKAGSNVTISEISNGIEISSAGSVEDVVKTVNGVSPDADGDVTVDTGLMSIEVASEGTVLPDANGKIEILVGANMDIEVYPTLHQIGIMSTATALTKKSKTLTSANWNNNQLTLIEPEITTSSDIFVSPDPSDWSAYNAAGIRAVSQGTGSLTFECDTTPTSDIGVNLVIGRLNV